MPGGRIDGVGFSIVEDADGAMWLGTEQYGFAGPYGTVFRLASGAWTIEGNFDTRVTTLALQGNAVIAGGTFTQVDGQAITAVAIRSGTTWSALGTGIGGEFAYVNTVAVSPALGILVGGQFQTAGGVVAEDLARFDGTAWHALGADFVTDDFGAVSALLPYGNGVFVSGGFPSAGGVAGTRQLAWYDGAAWHALETGLADLAEAMVVADDVLYVGGPFTAAGGYPASGLAAWDFSR
jgi:trimeric autotransporter adhesin